MVVGFYSVKQAVILAGGQGVRMKPLTNYVSKGMIPFHDIPLLEHLIRMLIKEGITEVIILIGYMPDQIMKHFGNGSKFGIDIKYHKGLVEDNTGTRIRNAKHLLNKYFLLLYCDTYWDLDLESMVKFYNKHKDKVLLTSYNNKNGDAEYGNKNNLLIDGYNMVLKYDNENPTESMNGIDIGFFLINKKLLKDMPTIDFQFGRDYLPYLIEKKKLVAYRTDRQYCNLTCIKDLKRMSDFIGLYNKV
jgi:NDP-sugar pyrophosphorylase family protein